MSKIGLSMIVKDEAANIVRCLDSVRPIIDYVLIVDTGSTDDTPDIILSWLNKNHIMGYVAHLPWVDFSTNRTQALELLREIKSVDYAFVIDADDTLVVDETFRKDLTHDIYDVLIVHGGVTHFRPQIFRNRLGFRYKGVLHEFLEGPYCPTTRAIATGISIRAGTEGARSRNPRKYEDDARTLERALEAETDPFVISRYTFYLAQSYRDCGSAPKSIENYLKRADLGFWIEEQYVALVEAGNLITSDECISVYLRAANLIPQRAEAYYGLSRYCRLKERYKEGKQYGHRGIYLAPPERALFSQLWVYEYGILDEFAVNAYWAGAYRESLGACIELLSRDLPKDTRKRVADNATFALLKLAPKGASTD